MSDWFDHVVYGRELQRGLAPVLRSMAAIIGACLLVAILVAWRC